MKKLFAILVLMVTIFATAQMNTDPGTGGGNTPPPTTYEVTAGCHYVSGDGQSSYAVTSTGYAVYFQHGVRQFGMQVWDGSAEYVKRKSAAYMAENGFILTGCYN